MAAKGSRLEEDVRAYFDVQGCFALRSVAYRYEEDDITDVDVWVYRRELPDTRIRAIVDVKNKRSPKTYERILWVRGLQSALKCDRAFVATTSTNPKVAAFGRLHNIGVLPKRSIAQNKRPDSDRMTWEEFVDRMSRYMQHKQDGDWVKRIRDSKSAVVSLDGFPAFNKVMVEFKFFGERLSTREYHREQAFRGMSLTAAVACIALDNALIQVAHRDERTRYRTIADGVTYGEMEGGRMLNNIQSVLDVIQEGVENGRVIARRAGDVISKQFETIRADIIAEYFAKEQRAENLVKVARELEALAHAREVQSRQGLSVEAKAVLGVFADFVEVERSVIVNPNRFEGRRTSGCLEENVRPQESAGRADEANVEQGVLFDSERGKSEDGAGRARRLRR